jgi:predicted Zn-dependent protease
MNRTMTGAPSCRRLGAAALLSVLLAGAGSGSFAQTTAEESDDLTAVGRIVGTDINRIAAVVRYHSAILMTRMEQFESAYEALQQFVYQNNTSPKVVEALGLSILRMRYLPSEYPPAKREIVMLAGRAAYETAARRAENADRLYQELVSRYPDEATVHYAYGAFLMGSKPDLAVQQFQQELKKNPDHVPSLLQIGMEYLRQGRYQEALPLAERAHRLMPNFFTSRKVLGRVLLETGQVERAVQELEVGVQLKPEDPEMHFALSRAYARAGRKAEAERARREFLRLDRIYRSQREGPQSVGGQTQP